MRLEVADRHLEDIATPLLQELGTVATSNCAVVGLARLLLGLDLRDGHTPPDAHLSGVSRQLFFWVCVEGGNPYDPGDAGKEIM